MLKLDANPAIQKILERVPSSGEILIVLDKDGTLDPLVADRNAARVPSSTVQSIMELSNLKDVEVIIVSGRGVQDLRNLVGNLPIEYWGLHGAENGRGNSLESTITIAHEVKEEIASSIKIISEDSRLKTLETTYGVPVAEMIETKELAGSMLGVAVHFRTLIEIAGQDSYYQIEKVISDVVENATTGREGVVIQPGNCVFEIKPKGITKGTALETILNRGKKYSAVIVGGDDHTDLYMMDKAVEKLGSQAIPVVVGERINHPAGIILETPEMMGQLLQAIINKRESK